MNYNPLKLLRKNKKYINCVERYNAKFSVSFVYNLTLLLRKIILISYKVRVRKDQIELIIYLFFAVINENFK